MTAPRDADAETCDSTRRDVASATPSGVTDPREVDYADDAIVVDLTKDDESQDWLDERPSWTPFTELSSEEKETLKRRARDKIRDR